MRPKVPSEYVDYIGRRINLDPTVVEHIEARHPEMSGYLSRTGDVLGEPDFVYFRHRTSSYLFYKLGVSTGKLANTYMVVVVRYNELGEGKVRRLPSLQGEIR